MCYRTFFVSKYLLNVIKRPNNFCSVFNNNYGLFNNYKHFPGFLYCLQMYSALAWTNSHENIFQWNPIFLKEMSYKPTVLYHWLTLGHPWYEQLPRAQLPHRPDYCFLVKGLSMWWAPPHQVNQSFNILLIPCNVTSFLMFILCTAHLYYGQLDMCHFPQSV